MDTLNRRTEKATQETHGLTAPASPEDGERPAPGGRWGQRFWGSVTSRHERAVAMLLALGLAIYFLGLGQRSLWAPDEGRYAEIPREMVTSGDWLTPRLNGVKYFEKPPL